MGNSNSCPKPKNEADLLIIGEPMLGSLTFQHLMLIISAAATGVTLVLSLWLIIKHLHRYTEPRQQRQIIRIIFTPVVFSVLSVLSILSYSASYYLSPLCDLYETFALASVFLLFTEYVAPEPATRPAFFAKLENRKKKGSPFSRKKEFNIIPGGSLRWFHAKLVAVFIYVFIMIIMTAAEEISQALKTYCSNSLSPKFANIWILIVSNVAITFAIQGVITYFTRLMALSEFTMHKPLLKLISFKLIVFVNFIQRFVFSILTGQDLIHGDHRITGKDLAIGIPALMVALEQILFALFFHYSFRSREYHETEKAIQAGQGGVRRMGTFRAALHAFNPSDIIYGVFRAFQLLFSGVGPGENGDFGKMGNVATGRGRGRYQQAPQTALEPYSTYQPQGRRFQSTGVYDSNPYESTTQMLGNPPRYQSQETQFLTADPESLMRYEKSRSRGHSKSSSLSRSRSRSRSTSDPVRQSLYPMKTEGLDGDARSARSMV